MESVTFCGSWAVPQKRTELLGVRVNVYGHHERNRAEDVIRESEKALALDRPMVLSGIVATHDSRKDR